MKNPLAGDSIHSPETKGKLGELSVSAIDRPALVAVAQHGVSGDVVDFKLE